MRLTAILKGAFKHEPARDWGRRAR